MYAILLRNLFCELVKCAFKFEARSIVWGLAGRYCAFSSCLSAVVGLLSFHQHGFYDLSHLKDAVMPLADAQVALQCSKPIQRRDTVGLRHFPICKHSRGF